MNHRIEKMLTALMEKVATEKYKQGFLDGVFMVSAYGIDGTRQKCAEDPRNLRVIADEARALAAQRPVPVHTAKGIE